MRRETRERLELGLQMEEDWVWEREVGKHILVVVNRKFVFPFFFFFLLTNDLMTYSFTGFCGDS